MKQWFSAALSLVVLAESWCVAADLTNEQRAFFERCEAYARAFVPRAERDLRFSKRQVDRMKTARIGRNGYPTKEAKQEAIRRAEMALKTMEAIIDEVKAGDRLIAPPFAGHPPTGAIGRLGPGSNSARIIQVVDKQSVLAEVSFGRSGEEVVFIDKIDASNLVDDTHVRLDENFKVMAPRTYETANGTSNTVLWLRPVDINDELLGLWKAYQKEKRGR